MSTGAITAGDRPAGSPRPGGARRLARLAAIVAGTAVAGLGGYLVTRQVDGPPAPVPTKAPVARPMPTSPAIEQEWGVRFSHIGISADDGVIDVRYRVLDERLAEHLRHHGQSPLVIEGPRGFTTAKTSTNVWVPMGGPIRTDYEYYVLFPNIRGKVHPGDEVTLVLGGLRLEHVPVE